MLRALLVVLAGGALLAATVDPDELLRVFRRVSLRSALTAALADAPGAGAGAATRAAWPTRAAAGPTRRRARGPPSGCRSCAR